MVEEEHLDALDGLKILFLPRVIATDEALERRLEAFVREGGTLVCESETGAFSPEGIYREESRRFTARLAGIEEIGRRKLRNDWIPTVVDGRELRLDATQWLTPWQRGKGEILADSDEGAAIVDVPVGKGHLILCGSYLGQAYYTRECGRDADRSRTGDFERFVEAMARRSGWRPDIEVLAPAPEVGRFLYVKTGESGGRKVVFVFFQEGHREARLRFAPGFIGTDGIKDLMTGDRHALVANGNEKDLTLPAGTWRFSVLVEDGCRRTTR